MTMTSPARTEVETDIKETLGLVPSFFSQIPDEFIQTAPDEPLPYSTC